MSQVCEYCDTDVGLYDFARDCCVTRFLVHAPSTQIRQNYIAWLAPKIGEERMQMIKTEVAKAWQIQRDKALNYAKGKA